MILVLDTPKGETAFIVTKKNVRFRCSLYGTAWKIIVASEPTYRLPQPVTARVDVQQFGVGL